jgi:hypothetical protein
MYCAQHVARICGTYLFLASALILAPISAKSQEYIFDIVKRNSRILRAWEWIVPSAYSTHQWIKQLNGTTGPVDRVVVKGKPFYLGSDGFNVYGMLRSNALNINNAFFGIPDQDEQRLMRKSMDELFPM